MHKFLSRFMKFFRKISRWMNNNSATVAVMAERVIAQVVTAAPPHIKSTVIAVLIPVIVIGSSILDLLGANI